ncbi:ATP-binding protein [Pseudoxanthomonas beigongshangi]|uniref:ATP-binding protein n=1 Tax=Pseudoxanthomonas beigongshangi TaxID=2782537 RepID=UPI00193B0510|nr:ATP-binding protein [Pseudoxanthomonas beigongshangi]
MHRDDPTAVRNESSPAARGGAGAYIEGELGAFYLLALLADIEPRGLPGSRIQRVRYQGVDQGFLLDDLVIHGTSHTGEMLLEIQSKRTISFAPKDTVFEDVCRQAFRSAAQGIPEDRHRLAIATQRTSRAISGPYQDVLEWARKAATGAEFFSRLAAKGVSGLDMRKFAGTFRANLVAAGVADDDDAIWRFFRRFLILEFDFESSAPLARTHGLFVARQILAPGDAPRAEALWSNLVEISLERAKAGGFVERVELRGLLSDRGFRFAGDRDFSVPRLKLAERSRQALAEIGNSVAGVQLPRLKAIDALDLALDQHRFVEISGGPGVGKSAVLKHAAERIAVQSNVLVLDPVSTPEGGWAALAQTLNLQATAQEFLADLATSGGGVIFIDSLDMFTSPARRRTVNDLLREVAAIEGLSIVATSRPEYSADGDGWLAPELASLLGPLHTVVIGELDDDEVETLREHAPELRALLAPGHAAAAIVRNLYRLSRLLKVPSTTTIRSEAALASHWWQTADSAESADRRAAQRLMADLADAALAGGNAIEVRDDSPARNHLLRSQTLTEPRRDHLRFYHDVLRDWAVGARLHEDPDGFNALDLGVPASAKLARGVEFAGRFALELTTDSSRWPALLERLTVDGSHSSWRRHALLAIVRSELSASLLDRCTAALLSKDGELLIELCIAVTAVETVSPADMARDLTGESAAWASSLSKDIRVPTTASAARLVDWCIHHSAEIPLQAIASVVKLVQVLYLVVNGLPRLAAPIAGMLFGWLRQLDEQDADVLIPAGTTPLRIDRRSMISELRAVSLLLSAYAPEQTKAYLRALAVENDGFKFKEIRPFSAVIARVAPQELADLVAASLIAPPDPRGQSRRHRDQAFSFNDGDYLPPSPAQTPFLDLLEASPGVGLDLVRKLVDVAVAFQFGDNDPETNGFLLGLGTGPRFFPWTHTYFWSRDQAREYSVASALMALEAWGHGRIEAGEPLDAVITDVLGPDGSCAAYLLVAIDLLLSNWPASRDLLVPFMASPELLATERGRAGHDRLATMDFGIAQEPTGKVRLANLQAKPSRGIALESLLPAYLRDDDASHGVRALLSDAVIRTGTYAPHSNFGDPAFMGAHALNVLDAGNWIVVGDKRQYQSPSAEAEHLARLAEYYSGHRRSSEIESKIQLAIHDLTHATTAVARESVEFANGELPDDTDSDVLRSRSTRLAAAAMLAARDGDDALLDEYENWVREVVRLTLSREGDSFRTSSSALAYNPQALSVLALIHLWRRRCRNFDRDALLRAAARRDRCAVPAFSAALDVVVGTDPRLLKSAARVAFATSRWRHSPWHEDKADAARYGREKENADRLALEAETAWLDGGSEPAWPTFPEEEPILRQHTRIRGPRSAGTDNSEDAATPKQAPEASVHVDTQAVAPWLNLLAGNGVAREWHPEIVGAYATWSARKNGFGHPPHVEVDREPMEWNNVFYVLVANELMDVGDNRFDGLLAQIEGLPDRSFGDVSEIVLHAADVCYFNEVSRSPERAVELRRRLVARASKLRYWNRDPRPGDLSVDRDTGGVVAKLLFNTHNLIGGTTSYLVPTVFDRIDPLLDVLHPFVRKGPTPFVALCTMNMLLIAPRVRHLDFFLHASEAWLQRLPTDVGLWVELGIGRLLVDWLNAVSREDPSLLARSHPMRNRIDSIVGQLVKLGVPGSYDFERIVEQSG